MDRHAGGRLAVGQGQARLTLPCMPGPTANLCSPDRPLATGSAVDPHADTWLTERCAEVAAGDVTALAIAFGHAGRRHPDSAAARLHLVLAIPAHDPTSWLAVLDQLFATAGLEELVTLYRGLPVYPHPELLRERCATGVRSTMQAVFEAVALDNSYPAQWLDEGALNQLVLKAFFLGCDPRRINGLRARVNVRLGQMLRGYVRERQAAHRPIPLGLDEVAAWCESESESERAAL